MPADKAIAALDSLIARLSVAGAAAVTTGGLAIQRVGMSKTRVKSGTLRRSWRTEKTDAGTGVYAVRVGPTTVYARRIELGFLPPLKDSLGRSFPNARPKPYVRPAFEAVLPALPKLLSNAFAAALKG